MYVHISAKHLYEPKINKYKTKTVIVSLFRRLMQFLTRQIYLLERKSTKSLKY